MSCTSFSRRGLFARLISAVAAASALGKSHGGQTLGEKTLGGGSLTACFTYDAQNRLISATYY